MEKELELIDQAIDKIAKCNLDDETKKFILGQLNKRVFELRREIASVQKNVEIYQGK